MEITLWNQLPSISTACLMCDQSRVPDRKHLERLFPTPDAGANSIFEDDFFWGSHVKFSRKTKEKPKRGATSASRTRLMWWSCVGLTIGAAKATSLIFQNALQGSSLPYFFGTLYKRHAKMALLQSTSPYFFPLPICLLSRHVSGWHLRHVWYVLFCCCLALYLAESWPFF